MVQLELTPEERDVLKDVLEQVVSDMGAEIADTDNYDYRQKLKERRGILSRIVAALSA